MSFSVGIIGLPNVGKSTLFKALTKKAVDIAPYPFTTIHPNVGIVRVPDERLEKIAEIVKPEKVTPTIIEFIDIAGLVKGASKGEGLGNQFLAEIRKCDAILEVIRAFERPEVKNMLGELNPKKEIEVLKTELLMKDLETLEKILEKIGKEAKSKDKAILKKFSLLEKIKNSLSQGKLISEMNLSEEEKREIKEYQFLTQKPTLIILNTDSKKERESEYFTLNLKREEENVNVCQELKSDSSLDQLILACYNILDLITFYTITGGKEARAWTLRRGENVLEAGAKVHSDFKEKFIRAEVINWQKLVEAGSWIEAKRKGLIKIAGKDYLVQDGDIIEFKI